MPPSVMVRVRYWYYILDVRVPYCCHSRIAKNSRTVLVLWYNNLILDIAVPVLVQLQYCALSASSADSSIQQRWNYSAVLFSYARPTEHADCMTTIGSRDRPVSSERCKVQSRDPLTDCHNPRVYNPGERDGFVSSPASPGSDPVMSQLRRFYSSVTRLCRRYVAVRAHPLLLVLITSLRTYQHRANASYLLPMTILPYISTTPRLPCKICVAFPHAANSEP